MFARSKGRAHTTLRSPLCTGSFGRSRFAAPGAASAKAARSSARTRGVSKSPTATKVRLSGRVPAAKERANAIAVEARHALGASPGSARGRGGPGRPRRRPPRPAPGRASPRPRRISSRTTSISREISPGSKLECSTASLSTSMPTATCDGGKRRVVDGDVERGVGVDAPAGALDLAGDLAHAAALGALEEHVLVEVGEPGLVGALVRRAHVRPDLQLDDGREVGFAQQHREPVGKHFTADVGLAQGASRVPERPTGRIAAWTTMAACRERPSASTSTSRSASASARTATSPWSGCARSRRDSRPATWTRLLRELAQRRGGLRRAPPGEPLPGRGDAVAVPPRVHRPHRPGRCAPPSRARSRWRPPSR